MKVNLVPSFSTNFSVIEWPKFFSHMDLILAKLCSRAEIEGGAPQVNELDAILLNYFSMILMEVLRE